jgi:peptide/nickel transport system permease protein
MLVVSFMCFGLVTLIPGDPALQLAGGINATPEGVAQVREQLNLDDPFLSQYWSWLNDALHFDLGQSLQTGENVATEIGTYFPITASIVLAAITLGLLIGVTAGVIAGMRPGSLLDKLLMFGTTLGIAVPNFWLAMVLISIFAINLEWFPALGFTKFTDDPMEWLRAVTLPSVGLGVAIAAGLARQVRAALADTMSSSFIRTAWAKGGSTLNVVGKHALKNAATPAVTIIGVQLGALLGATVLIEQIFSIPGLGTYVLRGIGNYDLPVVQGVALMFTVINISLSLLVDISYGLLNPKVRVS